MRVSWITYMAVVAGAFALGGAQAELKAQGMLNPSPNFGSGPGSGLGQTISSPGTNMFSTPLPSPSLGSLEGGGASSSGGGGTSGGAVPGADGGNNMMSQNVANPFAPGQGAAGTTARTGMGGNFGRGAFGRMGALSSMFNNRAFQNGFGQNDRPRLPTRLTVNFDHPAIAPSRAELQIVQRLNGLNHPNVAVSVEGRVATLTGTVDSEEDSRILERFVALEPGISSVVNQLAVQGPSEAP